MQIFHKSWNCLGDGRIKANVQKQHETDVELVMSLGHSDANKLAVLPTVCIVHANQNIGDIVLSSG